MDNSLKVLDHGFVRLDGYMADDKSVVNSARVSFGRRVDQMDKGDVALLQFLLNNNHMTPFEHNAFRFHIQAPIFVAREHFRHRIGSFNEFSGRYAVFPPTFYVPEPQHVRTQVGKPGSYTFEKIIDETIIENFRQSVIKHSELSYNLYEESIKIGVAREIARIYLPTNYYTQYYWTINARSLMNFLSLRMGNDAMWEIREYANAVDKLFAEKMPVTHEAFHNSKNP